MLEGPPENDGRTRERFVATHARTLLPEPTPRPAPTRLSPPTHPREVSGWRVVGCPDVKRSSPGTPPPANPTPHPNKPRAAATRRRRNSETPTAEQPTTYDKPRAAPRR
ncbi:hypothetical protein GCM10009864_82170 [Streptomyces lunalinharesii]|uniref:Uncharacterized protein n=1 Tax=Streptomyces lunalinharesii TaxID=333384 RepID=A0ABP6FND2_9ACTN